MIVFVIVFVIMAARDFGSPFPAHPPFPNDDACVAQANVDILLIWDLGWVDLRVLSAVKPTT